MKIEFGAPGALGVQDELGPSGGGPRPPRGMPECCAPGGSRGLRSIASLPRQTAELAHALPPGTCSSVSFEK